MLTSLIIGLALLTLLFPDLSVTAQYHNEEALQKTTREINGLIMCPLYAGQTIAQSSNETSTQMRNLVLKKLRQDETKKEILQYHEKEYYYGKEEKKADTEKTYHQSKTNGSGVKKEV